MSKASKRASSAQGVLSNYIRPVAYTEQLSFKDYVDLVIREPWVTRNMFQIMHDMILSSGVQHKITPGKPMEYTYNFFEDSTKVGDLVVFGQNKAKQNLLEKIDNASRGYEASKRLWILLGPPGSAKSRSMSAIQTSMKRYSLSEIGKTFTIYIPTRDERLREKAVFEKNGFYYLQAPIFERPLHIIPQDIRKGFLDSLNADINNESLEAFLALHPHYDGKFEVDIDGLASPFTEAIIDDLISKHNMTFDQVLDNVIVKRMIYDAKSKSGIGSYTPRDEKSQEAGSIVGNVDYSLLPLFGNESDPRVHDYKGELCVGANGLVEFHEILKLAPQFLYELLFATADRFFKPEGQPQIPFNGMIIGHTNFHEYEKFQDNPAFEALRSRANFIEMPLSIDFQEEKKIYALKYSNAAKKWTRDEASVLKHKPHTSPHSLELLSLIGVMSRLRKSSRNPDLTVLQKALIYAGRTDNKIDSNASQVIIEEGRQTKPTEGTFGLDPRFLQDVYEYAEHTQRHEYTANAKKYAEEAGGRGQSIAMENPCVSPADLHMTLKGFVKDRFKGDEEAKFLQQLKLGWEWTQSEMASDVYEAILQDDTIVANTWKNYTDHVTAYVKNQKVREDLTRKEVDPNEDFMSKIEDYLGIPDKDVFRKELSDCCAAVSDPQQVLDDAPSYQNAIKRYVFECEFKNKDNQKLLGWVKSGLSGSESNRKEQDDLDRTIRYLIEKKGYCGKCAYHALTITSQASSIN